MNDLAALKTSKALRILYPIWMIIGIFGLIYVPSQIFMSDDAIATAENIKNQELLFRFGVVARLAVQLLGVLIPMLLFTLFKSINRNAAALMLLLSLIGVPISMHGEAHSLFALTLLEAPELMMAHLDLTWVSLNIASIFWGLWLFPLGYLAIQSDFFPKVIGYCQYIAGLGYLTGAFLKILFPSADLLYSITEFWTIGEIIFILWFVFRGLKYIPKEAEVV